MIEVYIILKQNGPSFSLDKWAQLETKTSVDKTPCFSPQK